MTHFPNESKTLNIQWYYAISTVVVFEIIKKWIGNEYPFSKEELIRFLKISK